MKFGNSYFNSFSWTISIRNFKILTHTHTHTYTSSSSSSSRTASTDFPDSFSIRPYYSLLPVSLLDYLLCPQVLVGHPTLACSCVGVHRRTSLMSLSLILRQYPTCLARLTWMVLEMGGKWPYSCLVRCCFWDLLKMSRMYRYVSKHVWLNTADCFFLNLRVKTFEFLTSLLISGSSW